MPFLRSEKTSNDFATTTDVIEEVIMEYRNRGQNFDIATTDTLALTSGMTNYVEKSRKEDMHR